MQNLINNLKKYNNVKLSVRETEALKEYFLKEIISLIENNFKDDEVSIIDGYVNHNDKNLTFFDDYRAFVESIEEAVRNSRQTDIEITKFGDHSALFQYLLDQLKIIKY